MEKSFFPAVKSSIDCLISGSFCQGDAGDTAAGRVIDRLGRSVAKVNIVATVIDKFVSADGNYMAVTVDDGSGTIRMKFFNSDIRQNQDIMTGDELMVVGRVKHYNGEVYISPEIVRKVSDLNHTSLRRLEVLKGIVQFRKLAEGVRTMADKEGMEAAKTYAAETLGIAGKAFDLMLDGGDAKKVDAEEVVTRIIKGMDDGSGVGFETILRESRLGEGQIDSVITKLLEDGAIFEPHAGRFKIVG